LYSRTYSILVYIRYISPDIYRMTRGRVGPTSRLGRRLLVTSRLVGPMATRIN